MPLAYSLNEQSFTTKQQAYPWVSSYLKALKEGPVSYDICKSFLESMAQYQTGLFTQYSQMSFQEPAYAEKQFRTMAANLVDAFCTDIETNWQAYYQKLRNNQTLPTDEDMQYLSPDFRQQQQQTILLRAQLMTIQPGIKTFTVELSKKKQLEQLDQDRKELIKLLLNQTNTNKETLDSIREEYRRRKLAKSNEVTLNQNKINRLREQIVIQQNTIISTLGSTAHGITPEEPIYDLPLIEGSVSKPITTAPSAATMGQMMQQLSQHTSTLRSAPTSSLQTVTASSSGLSQQPTSGVSMVSQASSAPTQAISMKRELELISTKQAHIIKAIQDIFTLKSTMDSLEEIDAAQKKLLELLTQNSGVLQTNLKKIEAAQFLEQEAIRATQLTHTQQESLVQASEEISSSPAAVGHIPPPPPMPSARIGAMPPPPPPLPPSFGATAIPRSVVPQFIESAAERGASGQEASATKRSSMAAQKKTAYHSELKESAFFQKRRAQIAGNTDDEEDEDDEWEEVQTKSPQRPQFPPLALDSLQVYYKQESFDPAATQGELSASMEAYRGTKSILDGEIAAWSAKQPKITTITKTVQAWVRTIENRCTQPTDRHQLNGNLVQPTTQAETTVLVAPSRGGIADVTSSAMAGQPITQKTLDERIVDQIKIDTNSAITILDNTFKDKLQSIRSPNLSDPRVADLARLYCYKLHKQQEIKDLTIPTKLRVIYLQSLDAFFDDAVEVCIDEAISARNRIIKFQDLADSHFPHRHVFQRYAADGLVAISFGIVGLIRKLSGRSFFFTQAPSDRKAHFCNQLDTSPLTHDNQPILKPSV